VFAVELKIEMIYLNTKFYVLFTVDQSSLQLYMDVKVMKLSVKSGSNVFI